MAKKNKSIKFVEVNIQSIGHKGMAIGRTDEGEVVFTNAAVPGDRVKVQITKKRKGVWNGKTSEIISPSIHRDTAFCKHFGVCGGCSWQNLKYEEQLNQKDKLVRDSVTRIAKVDAQDVEVIMGAQETQRYRNKLEYTFSPNRWFTNEEINSEKTALDSNALGFHRPESFYKIVNIEQCWLQHENSDNIRNWTKQFFLDNAVEFYSIKTHSGIVRNLILRNNLKGEFMLTLSAARDNEITQEYFNQIQIKFPFIKAAFFVLNTKKNDTLFDLNFQKKFGEDHLEEILNHVKFKIGPKSFFQTNSKQTIRLYSLVKEYAELSGKEIVYDLYCGVGSIGIFLADAAKKIIGIEEIPEAIEDAKVNAANNVLDNTSFFSGDVKKILNTEFIQQEGAPDVMVLDPPRMGLHEDAIRFILELKPPKIVYVSCNPATFARDMQLMSQEYTLAKYKAVDMFPHTNHVELVAQLIKK